MRVLVSLGLVGVLALAATPINWGVEGGDNNRSGQINDILKPPLMIATNPSGEKLIQKLGRDEEDSVFAPPVVADGKIYVGSLFGRLHCIDIDTLEEDWHIDRNGIARRREIYRSCACVDGDKLYIGDMLGIMTCIDTSGQKVLWERKFPQWLLSSPIVDGETLIFGTDDEYVRALDKNTGQELWKSERLAGPANNGIAQNEDLFYIGCWGTKKGQVGNLECISKKTGKKVWANPTKTGGAVSSTPTCSSEFVFVASTYIEDGVTKGKLTCVSASEEDGGYIYWESDDSQLINMVRSSPVITPDGNKVIIGCRDKSVYCFDASAGNLLWQTEGFSHINSSGITSDNYYYIGSQDGFLNVLDINAEGNSKETVMVHPKNFSQRIFIDSETIDGIGSVGTPAYYDGHIIIINKLGEIVRVDPAPFGEFIIGKNKFEITSDIKTLNLDITVRNGRKPTEVQPKEPFTGKLIIECVKEPDTQETVIDSASDETNPKLLYEKSFKLSPWDSDLRITRVELEKQLEPGKYDIHVRIVDHNAHWIKLIKPDGSTETAKYLLQNGKSVPKGYEIIDTTQTLTLNVTNPLPLMILPQTEFILTGKIYDDEIEDNDNAKGEIQIQNEGTGILEVEIEFDRGLELDKANLTIMPGASDTVGFWLDPKFDFKPGDYTFEVRIRDTVNDVTETVKIGLEVLRSKSVVVVWIGSKNAKVNDELTQLDAPPYIKNGTTMVPLRLVSEGLGFELEWIPELKTIIIDLGGDRYLRLVIDYPIAIVEEPDGTLVQQKLAVAPEVEGGRTFVPLRFIGEIIGAEVEWEASTKQVTLTRSLKE